MEVTSEEILSTEIDQNILESNIQSALEYYSYPPFPEPEEPLLASIEEIGEAVAELTEETASLSSCLSQIAASMKNGFLKSIHLLW